jgi:hypothetical protein
MYGIDYAAVDDRDELKRQLAECSKNHEELTRQNIELRDMFSSKCENTNKWFDIAQQHKRQRNDAVLQRDAFRRDSEHYQHALNEVQAELAESDQQRVYNKKLADSHGSLCDHRLAVINSNDEKFNSIKEIIDR